MKSVLFGCEESAVCREEFKAAGWDAWSCDLVPSRVPGQHIQGDVIAAINSRQWDLIFCFPPCTHLAVSGNRWYGKGTGGEALREKALAWTFGLWTLAKMRAKIGCGFENPIGVYSKVEKPAQVVQPWMFGHGETKATCLWLHNLPPLKPTNIVEGREQRIWKMAPSQTRQRDRSVTYGGLAKAMCEQWSTLETPTP